MVDINDRRGFHTPVCAKQPHKWNPIDGKTFVCPVVIGDGIHHQAEVIRLELELVEPVIGLLDFPSDGGRGWGLSERAQLCFQRIDAFRPICHALEFLHETQQRAVGKRNQLPVAPCIRKGQGK